MDHVLHYMRFVRPKNRKGERGRHVRSVLPATPTQKDNTSSPRAHIPIIMYVIHIIIIHRHRWWRRKNNSTHYNMCPIISTNTYTRTHIHTSTHTHTLTHAHTHIQWRALSLLRHIRRDKTNDMCSYNEEDDAERDSKQQPCRIIKSESLRKISKKKINFLYEIWEKQTFKIVKTKISKNKQETLCK